MLFTIFGNHSVRLGEKCQSIAQSYHCTQRIESRCIFSHFPSQNSVCVPSLFIYLFTLFTVDYSF